VSSSTTASTARLATGNGEADNTLLLQHGEKMIFGKEGNRGIVVGRVEPESGDHR